MAQPNVFHVQRDQRNRTLAAALRGWLPGNSWTQVRRLIHARRVMVSGNICVDETRRLRERDVVKILPHPAPKEPDEHDIRVVYFDPHVCVVEKPPGINSNRQDDEDRGRRPQFQLSLAELLPRVLKKIDPHVRRDGRWPTVFPVHRLDRDTGGLMVFARTRKAERHLGWQFRQHSVHRRYLAIVAGRVEPQTFKSVFVRDRGDGRRGSYPFEDGTDLEAAAKTVPGGRIAITHVRPVETIGEYTVIECRLETGRTHQIRIHLSEAGHPICGEKVYNRPLRGRVIPDASGVPRLALHAAELGFEHPMTGKILSFTSPWPRDLQEFLKRLRKS